ncbi:MAG: TfoX family protein [Afipia sp.]|nr:MAG: TfoX family protein [Afipia sp.]
MDSDLLIDLFSEFGPISLRKMFSGFGIAADGVNFAMALRAGIIFRVDELTIPRYDAEGAKPFQYDTRNKTVVVNSYRHLPERLYDDPEELAEWAREAVGAAKRAAAKKSGVKKRAPKKVTKSASRSATKAKPPASKKAPAKAAKGRKVASRRKSAKKRQAT